MLMGNIRNLEEYEFLGEKIQKCFAYMDTQNMGDWEKGRHILEKEWLFVNIVEYATSIHEKRPWEAHRKYLDIHFMLRGREKIELNVIHNMDLEQYEEEKDFLPMRGKSKTVVTMEPGDFLICWPGDGHRTGIAAGNEEVIKKAIFKVRIS